MYGQYTKMDNVTPFVWTASIGFGFWFLKGGSRGQGWRISTVAIYPLLLWTIFSNLRVNLKYQPWTPQTIGLYRFVRYTCIIIICVNQAVGQATSNSSIAYFVTSISLLYGMCAVVHFDGYKGVIAAYKKKKSEMGDKVM